MGGHASFLTDSRALSAAVMPSSVGILVYKDDTSSVHKMQSLGRGVDYDLEARAVLDERW